MSKGLPLAADRFLPNFFWSGRFYREDLLVRELKFCSRLQH